MQMAYAIAREARPVGSEMKIEHIEEFVDLSRTLSFTQTAEHFFVTQPVLSKHIAALERELGGQLFDRSRQGIQLTPFGEALLPTAQMLVGDRNRLLAEAKSFNMHQKTTIRVGYLQGAAGTHIPNIQRRFYKLHPEVAVEYFTYEFDRIFESLNNRSVDIIIGGLSLSLSNDIYEIRPVYEDSYYALVTSDSPLAKLQAVTPRDLRGKTVVIPAPSFFERDIDVLVKWLNPKDNDILILESVHDINTAPLSVSIDNSVSLTFGHLASYYKAGYSLVPLKDFDAVLDIAVIWRKSYEKPFFDDFARVVQEVIDEFGY